MANELVVTGVKVKKVENGNTRAYVSITLNDAFLVRDIKVIEGKNGLFVAFPNRKKDEKYVDIAHPVTAHAREMIQQAILDQYHQEA